MATNAITVTINASDVITCLNLTEKTCVGMDELMSTWFRFGTLNLVRVIVAWTLFTISLAENIFVLWALAKNRSDHFIMFHLILSNIVYTCFVMPLDAVWNSTMHWLAADWVCRGSQMFKQFGMYASSFMVVVVSLDRVTGLLCPMRRQVGKRATVMVAGAWFSAFLCCVPAAVIYSLTVIPTCEGVVFYQCVDFLVVLNQRSRAIYYLYTMMMSFILPFIVAIISYSLLVYEISNMKRKEKERLPNGSKRCMQHARKRAVLLKSLTAFTFLLCWGPYYGKGIYDWFVDPSRQEPLSAGSTAMYVMMYLNPVLQPLIVVCFMKQVRNKFSSTTTSIRSWTQSIFKG